MRLSCSVRLSLGRLAASPSVLSEVIHRIEADMAGEVRRGLGTDHPCESKAGGFWVQAPTRTSNLPRQRADRAMTVVEGRA